MATLKEQLAQLTDEELLALEQEILKSNNPEGIQADTDRLQASGVGPVGRGLLEGATRGGRAVVSGVREMAGMEALPEEGATGDLTTFEAKERIKSRLRKEEVEAFRGGAGEGAEFIEEEVTVGGRKFKRVETPEEIEKRLTFEAEAKGRIKEATDLAAQKIKIKMGRLVSKSNLETIAGVGHDLSTVFVDAIKEGGAGGAIQRGISELAGKVGDLPGGIEIGGKFPASGAFPGKRQELILKMMPMLTQQATKPEGSIRLITGVLDAIGQTIPERGTAARVARRQLQESLLTFYRFARSAELLGMDFDKQFDNKSADEVSDEEISDWISRINAAAGRIKIVDEELDAVNGVINEALSPFNELLGEEANGQVEDGELQVFGVEKVGE